MSNNLQETTYRRDAWKTENTLTYDKTFGEHTVGALFSTTADHSETRGLEVTGKDFADESEFLQYMAYAGSVTASDYLTGPDANVSLIAVWLILIMTVILLLHLGVVIMLDVCLRKITMVISLQ